MALEITQQPDIYTPSMVRNAIEVALETDNYIVPFFGQKKIIDVLFAQIINMTTGSQFHVLCNGVYTIFDIVNTITALNQIETRANFPAGTAVGDNLYGQHIRSILNAHPNIAPYFTGGFIYAGLTYTNATSIEFTSVNNGNLSFEIGVVAGGFFMTNNVLQIGIADELNDRPTVINISMLFVAQGNPIDGDYFYIKIDGTDYFFLFKNIPNNSGFELPLRGAMSLTDYQNLLLSRLKSAPFFLDKIEVTTALIGGEINFIFTAINSVPAEITVTNNVSRYVWTNTPGYQAVYQQNFTTNLRLFCEKNYNTAVFERLIDLYDFPKNEAIAGVSHYVSRFKIDKILYDFMNKTYNENLSEALPYVVNFPNAKHLLKKFYFKIFESYGAPATNKIISDAGYYIAALYGAGHIDFIDRKFLQNFGLMHNSGNQNNALNIKQYVDIDQPSWLYFFVQRSDGNDIGNITRVYYRAYFTDETSVENDIAAAVLFAVPINQTKTFFVKSGYQQLNLASLNAPTKTVYAWDIIIDIDGDHFLTKKLVLDCCSTYKTFLMYQNSCGGYETATISAPKEFTLEIADGKEIERILPTDYARQNSQFEATIPTVRQSLKCNLGFKKSSDFDLIKELLMSKFVFILPKNTTDVFIPINIDRKSITLESEDDFEKNFSFEFSTSHEFKNFENNLWLK